MFQKFQDYRFNNGNFPTRVDPKKGYILKVIIAEGIIYPQSGYSVRVGSESSQMQLKWQDVKKSGLAWNCFLMCQSPARPYCSPNSTIAAKVFAFTEIEGCDFKQDK